MTSTSHSSSAFSYRLPTPPRATRLRAALMIVVSLALHMVLLGAVHTDADTKSLRPTTETIEIAIVVEPRPAPVAAPVVRRRRPPIAPAPVDAPASVIREKVELIEMPAEMPAPQPSPEQSAPPEAPPPASDPVAVPGNVEPRDLVAELAESGVARGSLAVDARYSYRTIDSRYADTTGTTTIDWHFNAETATYDARLATSVIGVTVVDVASVGQVGRSGIAPERFTQKNLGRSALAANFDWAGQRLTYSARDYRRELKAGTQDWLSFQFQLMVLGRHLPEAFTAGGVVEFPVTGPRDVETYRFVVIGEEAIDTPMGPTRAVKLDRPRAAGGATTRIEVWLAPQMQWVPVKLRFTDRRNNVTESTLESIGSAASAQNQ